MSDPTEEVIVTDPNKNLVLICGYSGDGKSASLRNIKNQKKWMYLNSEAGKRLPFKNEFDSYNIVDPYQVYEGFDYASTEGGHEGIILDSLTFLMDMFESKYIYRATNTQQGWQDFAQFARILLQDKVAKFGKPVIITAHVLAQLDERAHEIKTFVPIKGSMKNNGVEAYFSTVVTAKKVSLIELEKYGSKLLNITEDEKELGFKHVYQTRLTKNTIGERIRSPMGMFARAETYIDNDAQLLLEHLHNYYN